MINHSWSPGLYASDARFVQLRVGAELPTIDTYNAGGPSDHRRAEVRYRYEEYTLKLAPRAHFPRPDASCTGSVDLPISAAAGLPDSWVDATSSSLWITRLQVMSGASRRSYPEGEPRYCHAQEGLIEERAVELIAFLRTAYMKNLCAGGFGYIGLAVVSRLIRDEREIVNIDKMTCAVSAEAHEGPGSGPRHTDK
jgi:hypothetical protein